MSRKLPLLYSHIKGLGIDEKHQPQSSLNTIIGQENARKAASIIVEMVRQNRFSGHGIFIVGPSGCGKTALAYAMSQEIGCEIPFNIISSTEITSSEINKSEALMQYARMSTKIIIKEIKDIYEGEVVSISIVEDDTVVNKGEGRILFAKLELRTSKECLEVKISPLLYEMYENENIDIGDIIYIESNSGVLKKIGRCEQFLNETEIEAENYVPLPKTEVMRRRELWREVTLHEMDESNSRPTGSDPISSFNRMLNSKKPEISDFIRNNINDVVNEYVKNGNCNVIKGVLFIEDADLLDAHCISSINKILDGILSPIIILSMNKVDENNVPIFTVPKELLNRFLIIQMCKNTKENQKTILKAHLIAEKMEIDDETFEYLSTISLRQVIGLIPLLKTIPEDLSKHNVQKLFSSFCLSDQ
ncbi:hypothetical protein EDEG_00951 [Edhazardia aedis USNM 41457]|uniref:RuvB-like helicase n=1 Tax=Edhazardia aedis (strain USNM 41457) TaxID=1003232 RepID=J8ZYV3_EDHAE|nr:hypothetical protein EDEG_00951 [Edhazardia aedis USNM 41457]|eukprot:EJW04858.1 hypothetical protein EDEG_00951 [Edhazardia aedis USNM 41457]